ncbi:Uncharacterized protein T310_4777 [Rasamsonia emersonii CBS 393.64]|uniref:TauD/TfdA-like domain-containing protein n=1 Tax=Rasamsonia emersonii (strain ATCC 16479 / CBS 393.64 / IMI 116815) TaxID=1408163 RepID=A0A0F4YSK0_RASE3|nr:Uncharacterized protein T310_4777 [Rasamsonia emersonii CBS 393.64]KKA21199.1 Uncharacterized protein T310_4777 [Rasamsonia emersonii CBS 393.64]
MAPGVVDTLPTPPHQLKGTVDLNLFPDGLKTTGQHPPIYEELKPFEAFPKEITGPTVWTAEEYREHPEKWTHRFTEEELEELSTTADKFIASGTPLTGISKSNFPLPKLGPFLLELRDDLLNGKGFILFKGLPVQEWGNHKSAVAYMGLGTYLGYFVSQNSRGHVLGHVKDLGEDPTQIDKVRIYRTNARQYFHADDSDIVGLLCIARALEGGESDVVSSHHVYNVLYKERPDVLKTLSEPIWYFDRKGETSKGQEEWIRTSVIYLERGENPRVYTKWDPYYVRSLTRFSDKGLIPPLSDAQQEALRVLEETCQRLSLHMILEVGDIQFLANSHVLHARTAYKDHLPPAPRRHLMRLWLATPESEGGWRLPFWDSNEKKRGGIQVDDTPPVAPLDAEPPYIVLLSKESICSKGLLSLVLYALMPPRRIHIAVLDTDVPVPTVYAARGLYSSQFRVLLQAAAARLNASGLFADGPVEVHTTAYDVVGGALPPLSLLRTQPRQHTKDDEVQRKFGPLGPVDALLITGSSASAYRLDLYPWIAPLQSFIQTVSSSSNKAECHDNGYVSVAACPDGYEVGIHPIALNPAFVRAFPGIEARLPGQQGQQMMRIQLIHGDRVTASESESGSGSALLPSPWLNIGSTNKSPIQGLYHPSRVLTYQGHFEFDTSVNRETCLEFARRQGWSDADRESYLAQIGRASAAAAAIPGDGDDDDAKIAAEIVLMFLAGVEESLCGGGQTATAVSRNGLVTPPLAEPEQEKI